MASGPKEVEIKIEEKDNCGVYNLYISSTLTLTETHWTSDGSKITDNTKNTSNKYSTFSYTPSTDFPLGSYRITLTGKDKAENSSSPTTFNFSIAEGTWRSPQKLETKVIEEEKIPAETEEEKEKIKEEGHAVKIKVVDINKKPIKGAKVTLYSEPKEAITDEKGIATFENVKAGNHKIVIAYKGQVGEQKVNLEGEIKEFDFTIQIKQTNPFFNPYVILIIGFSILLVGFLTALLIRAKQKSASG